MIFNHQSAQSLDVDRETTVDWLHDVVQGMSCLVQKNITTTVLRMHKSHYEIVCLPEFTLASAMQSLRERGFRDNFFFQKLITKVPILSDTDDELRNRFAGCEAHDMTMDDAGPLVLCALTEGILISFPSRPVWAEPLVEIRISELFEDEEIREEDHYVHNLSKESHTEEIKNMHLSHCRASMDGKEWWKELKDNFPNLEFGPDVHNSLTGVGSQLTTIRRKLSSLNLSAKKWQDSGSNEPTWFTRVSPESAERMRNPKFRNSRKFLSITGK